MVVRSLNSVLKSVLKLFLIEGQLIGVWSLTVFTEDGRLRPDRLGPRPT